MNPSEGSAGVPLSAAIALTLETGAHMELLRNRRGAMRQSVDFANANVRGTFNTSRYSIMIADHIPASHPVVVLFPNHKERDDTAMQVVRSSDYRSRDAFNRTLRARLEASLEHTAEGQYTRMAVAYGEHVFVCEGITGTPYVLWAEYLKAVNYGNVPNTVERHVPLIFNLNGTGRVKGIYALPRRVDSDQDLVRMPVTRHSPQLVFARARVPFVNESRPERAPPPAIPSMSLRQAVHLMTDLSKRPAAAHAFHLREASDVEPSYDAEILMSSDEGGLDVDALTGFMTMGESAGGSGPDDGAGTKDALGVQAALENPGVTPTISEDEYDRGADPFE